MKKLRITDSHIGKRDRNDMVNQKKLESTQKLLAETKEAVFSKRESGTIIFLTLRSSFINIISKINC